MPLPPAATWGYFTVAPKTSALRELALAGKGRVDSFRITDVIPVRDEMPASIRTGAELARLELPAPVDSTRLPQSDYLLQGVTQHLQYTTVEERDDLNARSAKEFPPSEDIQAVIIPIRKSAAWWAQAHDQRVSYFKKTNGRPGHTAIGAKYADRIFRKLYHARYLPNGEFDFITYFEFRAEHAENFRSLLAELRNPNDNPEWKSVETEFEIWMKKA